MLNILLITIISFISLNAAYPPITEKAALIWCKEAREALSFTKKFPATTDDHDINTLIAIAQSTKKMDDREKLYAAAYETNFIHDLYTHMYRDLTITPKRTSYDVYCTHESQRYLSNLQKNLFALPAWQCYAALHNAFDHAEYKALLYGNKDWSFYHDHDKNKTTDVAPHLFPTRHLHTPFHDLIDNYRPEYKRKNGIAQTELEMTTAIHHNREGDELYFKSVKQLGQYTKKVQPFFMLAIDAYMLNHIISEKSGAQLTYNFSMPNTSVEIDPAAYKYLARLPNSIILKLGRLSSESATNLTEQLKTVPCKKNGSNIILLNGQGKNGASLVFDSNRSH